MPILFANDVLTLPDQQGKKDSTSWCEIKWCKQRSIHKLKVGFVNVGITQSCNFYCMTSFITARTIPVSIITVPGIGWMVAREMIDANIKWHTTRPKNIHDTEICKPNFEPDSLNTPCNFTCRNLGFFLTAANNMVMIIHKTIYQTGNAGGS